MPDLVGYIAPDVRSGSFVAGQISLAPPDINGSIDTLRDLLTGVSWTNPTLDSGDHDGTPASGMLTALSFPFHDPASTHSGVPDTFGGAFAGTFDGITFQFYDPHATPPDPDPVTAGTIWVPLSTTALGTLGAFLGLASSETRWDFSMISGGAVEATIAVTAQHNGPGSNIDAYQGNWAPNGEYLGGPGPTGGGWNLYSAPAPVTGDVMKLRIYENTFGGTYPMFDLEMPSGSGQLLTYAFSSVPYNYGFNPYQAVLRSVPGSSYPVGGNNFLAAALNVPGEMGPVSIGITAVDNTSGVPVVVRTAAPHNLAMQDRVAIAHIVGAVIVNGYWWIAQVPSDNSFQLSPHPLVFIFGSGSAYTGHGGVAEIGTSDLLQIVDVRNDVADPVLLATEVAHGYRPGVRVEIDGIGGIPSIAGAYSVAAVPSAFSFEIATVDTILDGDGEAYESGGTLTTGIFQAMVATGDLTDLLYDGGQNTAIAVQGVFGSFPLQQRLHADNSLDYASLASYSVAIHVPFTGLQPGDDTSSLDLETTAAKPITVAPYVATRIAPGQEAHLTGTLWDSYVETQAAPDGYGQQATYQNLAFMAWVVHNPPESDVVATLWMKNADVDF